MDARTTFYPMKAGSWSEGNMTKITKVVLDEVSFDNEKLEQIYQKVVETPNKNSLKRGFIECPQCGEEILMIPTLRVMNNAIENHVRKHKELLKDDPIKEHQMAISIRLSLTGQVLQQACNLQIS
jgi:hypothetical protein